ncbi:MAG: RNA-binding transcriptional accessory protein [Candidatus Eisenbacteria bacterium]|uniref:RNA-binding transcriptional accessory protein n=1 Tax=Eiseniibacteriota bacterium TaxID=2212470 RepID=A0A956NET8_UNCEI|nr:RNA-binding transcriptional accessory protein [Candidatus Eisenbacteria bacterium]
MADTENKELSSPTNTDTATPPPADVPSMTPPDYAALIAAEAGLTKSAAAAIIRLLDEGATVPFIARYRKEQTGGAEDIAIEKAMERLVFHRELFDRKNVILATIAEQGKLTPELRAAIEQTTTRTELEDLYLPYRPKRRTRATMAKERGLEPLADRMWAGDDASGEPEEIAAAFIDIEKGVPTARAALQGARDILAEKIIETPEWRGAIRDLTWKRGLLFSQVVKEKAESKSKFSDYYEFSEPVAQIPSHRVLAILRGEKEGFLQQRIQPDPEEAKGLLVRKVETGTKPSIWKDELRLAAEDAYDRLLQPQIATDVRVDLKLQADTDAIEVFANNLRDLLMAPPFGSRPIMAIDPGFRTGCKVVVLSATGKLLEHGVVYPTEPKNDIRGTETALDRLFQKHPDISAIGVGNGTGGRETFAVVRQFLKSRKLDQPESGTSGAESGTTSGAASGAAPRPRVQAVLVNESGASVYSASEVAREELPDYDVTVRGAVSIGRRLQDPLAELVKIDPKSIGVGQYQHDVDQRALQKKLDDVVVSCVNQVGVDANTASPSLLQYVSGVGPRIAKAMVEHRDGIGGFRSRNDLLKVPGLGKKTFEQAAGFLRMRGANPLDDSAVHPERYELVERIAKDLGRKVDELIGDRGAISSIRLETYVDDSVGLFTLRDIVSELEKPGRDPRRDFEAVDFRDDVNAIEDLKEGMILAGTVTNVTHFGAFVDVGVHQDGLVHVSQIANKFVRDPADELHVGQKVKVKVLEIDLDRKRISLSIKAAES